MDEPSPLLDAKGNPIAHVWELEAVPTERLQAFITEWNQVAHPFNWSTKSVANVMAKCQVTEIPSEDKRPVAA